MEISKLKCNRCKCEFIPTLKPSGLHYKTCDRCREYNKEYKEENKDKIKKYYQENKDKIKEYIKQNTDKRKEQNEKYRKENAEKLKKYDKERNQTDERKEYRKKYKKLNPQIFKKIDRKQYQKVKNNLPLYLVKIQRRQIKRCFNNSTLDKSKHSIEYMGCDIEIFINHIKKKMEIFNEKNEIKMTFDNIHLDHIKPISRFNLDDEEEFLDCCHYSNFQPLLVKDNLEKHNKWTDDNNKFWIENIKGKEYYEMYI
jgi:hypothetical protein